LLPELELAVAEQLEVLPYPPLSVELPLLVPVWAPPQDCKLLFWYDQLPWPKVENRALDRL
jgi:hypothetical protein